MELKNKYSFYATVLDKLDEFLHSDLVEEKEWFSDYEKNAVKLAAKTFNEFGVFLDKLDK